MGLAGLLVNTAFVPVACFAALLYRDEDELRGVFLRLTSFAGLVGTMAIYQATLPADHWLNMSVDMAASGIRDGLGVRVPGTFQFCNVFGQYASGGLIACCGTIYAARNKLESAWGIGCGALLYLGVMESGSRMGALGSLAVVCACLAGSARLRTRVADAALLGVIAMGLVFLCSPSLLWRRQCSRRSRSRSQFLRGRCSGSHWRNVLFRDDGRFDNDVVRHRSWLGAVHHGRSPVRTQTICH